MRIQDNIPPAAEPFDISDVRTLTVQGRRNLVTLENMHRLDEAVQMPDDADFLELVKRILKARENGRPVIWSLGAHVIKNGLGRYLIELLRRGVITHISGNGAVSIHDFELAFLGGTSEDVATAIEDGTFGMWEETGAWMNEAIAQGAAENRGYGESLAVYIERHPDKFPWREESVVYQAWKQGARATYHIALGTDIIHQHPAADFSLIGKTSGIDFRHMCGAVSELGGGCFLNFGSGVIGPEVFLKALSVARNLGYETFDITTANFDLRPLGDYRAKIGYSDPNYYYRPCKNIVNRPTSRGGQGWHFVMDHQQSVPALYKAISDAMDAAGRERFQ